MGWGEAHRPAEPSARELLDAYAELAAAARAYLEHRSTGHEDELGDALRRLELTRRTLPTGGAHVPNSPYPPRPPVINGTTITRPLNLRGAR
jgi:hypothetical protein